jgi:hypothetical protein
MPTPRFSITYLISALIANIKPSSRTNTFVKHCTPTSTNEEFSMAPQKRKPAEIYVPPARRDEKLRGQDSRDARSSSSAGSNDAARDANKSKQIWMWKGTGKLLLSISTEDLKPSSTAVQSADGFDLLCAYNWAALASPTIYVPGK